MGFIKFSKKAGGFVVMAALCLGILVGCTGNDAGIAKPAPDSQSDKPTFTFDFEQDMEGWYGGFADLPLNYDESIFELEFAHKVIPVKGQQKRGLFLKGHNRSDDLFMFAARKLEGLKPDTNYAIDFQFDLATNVAGGMMGIGGAPGESVFVKAGFTSIEPKAIEGILDSNPAYIMNIDKNNQGQEGPDMKLIGHVAKDEGEDESYQFKAFADTFTVKSNSNGELYFIVGTDSGFEGLTELYYTNFVIEMKEQ